MKDSTIKVLVRKVGQEPAVEVIENNCKALQSIVGGNFEMPYNPEFKTGLKIVCNLEGKFAQDPKPNIYWGDGDIIFGDICFVGEKKGKTVSLSPEQIAETKQFIEDNDASEINWEMVIAAKMGCKVSDPHKEVRKMFAELEKELNEIK